MNADQNNVHQFDRQYKLFNELLDANDDQQRRRMLESIGFEEPELKAELEKLMEAHMAPSNSLFNLTSTNHPEPDLHPSGILKEGDRIDNYKILQLIGEGGMGRVYMAEQLEGIRRRVALKLMHSDRISKNSIARFEGEREALSRLDHPDIARILDAGQNTDGQHYFVMELIKGKLIIKFCDGEQLTLKQRLDLFEKACRAIHHAHQKGIIHRDIKPSNILIALKDGQPTVKVSDFGIAKGLVEPLAERTMFTRFGELIGTPNYMSPEQVESGGVDLDIRSNLYSLGVPIHELVTGKLPFEFQPNRGLLQQLQELRESEVIRPSRLLTESIEMNAETIEEFATNRRMTSGGLLRFVTGDLDWILLKVLSKTRSDRYDSAAAFANDIRRFLNHEPVEAIAPSWTYKMRKLITKHQTASVFGAASIASLIGLSLFSTYSAISSYNANSKLKVQTEQLQLEIVKSKKLESRAVAAEKQANDLARQRQNEAVIARATSAYFLNSVNKEKASLAPLLVMSEAQKGNHARVDYGRVVMVEDPVIMDVDSKQPSEEMIQKLRQSLDLDDVIANFEIEPQMVNSEVTSVTHRIISAEKLDSIDLSEATPEGLNRERIRLQEFIKNEQIK